MLLLLQPLWGYSPVGVYCPGATYVCGVGTDDREERWETIGAQLEALEEIAALTR